MLEEDVKDVVQHLRIAMTMFVEMIPDMEDKYNEDLPEVKAHKGFVLQSFNTAFLKLTRALWPSTTYWNLLPGNRVKYNPDRGNLYHKRRYHAMMCECFSLFFLQFLRYLNLYMCYFFSQCSCTRVGTFSSTDPRSSRKKITSPITRCMGIFCSPFKEKRRMKWIG